MFCKTQPIIPQWSYAIYSHDTSLGKHDCRIIESRSKRPTFLQGRCPITYNLDACVGKNNACLSLLAWLPAATPKIKTAPSISSSSASEIETPDGGLRVMSCQLDALGEERIRTHPTFTVNLLEDREELMTYPSATDNLKWEIPVAAASSRIRTNSCGRLFASRNRVSLWSHAQAYLLAASHRNSTPEV